MPDANTNVNVDDELNQLAGGVLGRPAPTPDNNSQPEESAEPEIVETEPYWGFEGVPYDEIERLAYRRLEEYGNELYTATSKRMVMQGYGGSVAVTNMPITDSMIKNLIYENLLQNREKYFVTPDECPTASTDGQSIYINPYFAAWMTPKELAFALAHEVNHILLHHIGEHDRTEAFIYGMKPDKNKFKIEASQAGLYRFRGLISNTAADLVINDQLVKDKIGELIVYKHGPRKGQCMGCYIPGFSDLSAEEAIVKFSNAVCKNGLTLVNEGFKKQGVNIAPPQLGEIKDLTQARQELEKLYNYINANATQFMAQQSQQKNQSGQESQSMGNPGNSQSQGNAGNNSDSGKDSSNKSGRGRGRGQSKQGSGLDSQSQPGGQPQDRESGQSKSGRANGKQNDHPQIGPDGALDDMAQNAIGDAISDILNTKAMNKTAEELAEAIAKAIAQGAGGGQPLDSHETSNTLLNDIAKEQNGDVSDVERQISENISVLSSKLMEKLEAMGISPEQLKGIGNIGSNIVAKWKARQVKAKRPYDMMLMRMFKLVKGISRDTYARHNKKTTVINKALKNYAKKTNTEPSRVIIPNKLSDSGKIVIAIDTSGSIFCDQKVGTMAVEEILRLTDRLNRQYTGSTIEVLMCDTDLHIYGEAKNKYEMQKMLDQVKEQGLDVVGGGGTDLLPIWEYILDEEKNARKRGLLPPSGLLVLTDTATSNLDKITQLYLDKKFRVPTVILAPSRDIETCTIWQDLAQKCPYFMLADIDEIQERSQMRAAQQRGVYEPER